MTSFSTDTVTVFSSEITVPNIKYSVDPEIITREWLTTKCDGAVNLEAVPCEEPELLDVVSNQPLFYLIIDAQGYEKNLPRNWNVEEALLLTVSVHTRCPTHEYEYAYVGIHGPAILVPKALVPKGTNDLLPHW